MRRFSLVLSIMILLVSAVNTAAAEVVSNGFNIKDYGATGDGTTLDTGAINKAIEACSAAGGGTVYFPAGRYLSGSVRLKNNITVYLDAGATLLGAPNDINAYDPPEDNPFDMYQDFGHSHWHNGLVWGEELENIAIIGRGTIDGSGMTIEDPDAGGGDKSISLKLCRNVMIKDITIRRAGHFAILTTGCDNMTIDGVKIDSNRDGINLDCCKNVRVSNCTINTPVDDGMVLKSSYGLGYKRVTENITITNCMFSGFAEGTMLDGTRSTTGVEREGLGGIKFGTETNGGFRNIAISNCVFESCDGLYLEIMDGGVMENVTISNIAMQNLMGVPVFIRLGNRARGPNNPPVGKIRNVKISNVSAIGAYWMSGSHITGIPGHPVENVRLSNINIVYDGGGTKEDARLVPPEIENAYPLSDMFGTLPSYGFFVRHVKGIEFHDVTVGFEKEDLRPALVCNDVEGLELDNFKAQRAPAGEPSVVLKNVTDIRKLDFNR